MSDAPPIPATLDGYRLLRLLGEGGFGQVWLCRSETTGDLHALKLIPAGNPDKLEKETEALLRYRKAASGLRSPYLTPIEHAGRAGAALFYVMPLADGLTHGDPTEPGWQPLTLAAMIQHRTAAAGWFSSTEIIALIRPVLLGLQTLSDAGLIHRDVKPENILFFGGVPCLADISLLGPDAAAATRRGTPGYITPSWYAGGHPDMYGAAATLYSLLTGNDPDKMGRAAFLWPPGGEASLAAAERLAWRHLHGVVRRAVEERVGERYRDYLAMSAALDQAEIPPRSGSRRPIIAATVLGVAAIGGVAVALMDHAEQPGRSSASPANIPTPAATHNEPTSVQSHEPVGPGSSTSQGDRTPPAWGFEPGAFALIDRSPRDSRKGSHGVVDAKLAVNSLQWIAGQGGTQEATVLSGAIARSLDAIRDPQTPDYRSAADILARSMEEAPKLGECANVRLARLLLLQCAGDTSAVNREMNDPSYKELRDDNLAYRVELLLRLTYNPVARQLLDECVASANATPEERGGALVERARLRAAFADHEGAYSDAERALELAGDIPSELALRRAQLAELESVEPNYAAFVRQRAGK